MKDMDESGAQMIRSENLSERKALVIGDVMLDVHHYGIQERTSAEAPIPVFDVVSTSCNPGGAANVAIHLANLGVEPYLVGVTGKDEAGSDLEYFLFKGKVENCYFHYPDHNPYGERYDDVDFEDRFPTTVKTRYYINGQQIFRSDIEKCIDEGRSEVHRAVCSMVEEILDTVNIDIILFQDYNKGVCSPYTIEEVMKEARKRDIPVFVDPKFRNVDAYKGVHLIKPNLKEFSQITEKELRPTKVSLDSAAKEWMKDMGISKLIVTLSEHGLYYNDGQVSGILPAIPLSHPDVSGAGDAVFATLAAAALLDVSFPKMADLANKAGSVACSDRGIQPLNWSDIQQSTMASNQLS